MPKLIIIAGCNGAGKSTFASSFLPEGLASFDYDRRYLENYHSLPDSELRERIAINRTTEDFKTAVENALSINVNFCYETNFDVNPIYWAEKFKDAGYEIDLIFFCIENQEIAKHRIQVRKEFRGHFVNDSTIDHKWHAGYNNLNAHYKFFDSILFVDNSRQNDIYTNLLQLEEGELTLMTDHLPDYFASRFPEIFRHLNS